MYNHTVVIYQVGSNYGPVVEKKLCSGDHMFYKLKVYMYLEKTKNLFV